MKRTDVLNYDPSLYRTTRLEATAADGTKVPVSLVWRADKREAAQAAGAPMPMLLDGYGSYGICCEPDFSYLRLPLLDRGYAQSSLLISCEKESRSACVLLIADK